jgi:hypothetical protein
MVFSMDVAYVYSVSDAGSMIPNVIRSIKSLSKYVDKKEIIVFFTPPTSKLSRAKLLRLAVVKETRNISKPFVFVHRSSRYGEKCHLCDVQSSTVVFLDADVVVKKDLSPLLIGDFDFSARKHFPTKQSEKGWIDQRLWFNIFRDAKSDPIPMPNAGFMIFKNYCHQKIREQWLRYVNDDKLPNACLRNNPKEQTALAIALSGKRIRWLTANEHAYCWLNEEKTDTYVLHKPFLLPKPLVNLEYAMTVYYAQIFRAFSNALFSE